MIKLSRSRFTPIFAGTMIVILTLMVGVPALKISVDLAHSAGQTTGFLVFGTLFLFMIATLRNVMGALHARVPGKIGLRKERR